MLEVFDSFFVGNDTVLCFMIDVDVYNENKHLLIILVALGNIVFRE